MPGGTPQPGQVMGSIVVAVIMESFCSLFTWRVDQKCGGVRLAVEFNRESPDLDRHQPDLPGRTLPFRRCCWFCGRSHVDHFVHRDLQYIFDAQKAEKSHTFQSTIGMATAI